MQSGSSRWYSISLSEWENLFGPESAIKHQLTLPSTRAGALVLTGSPTPFADQPVYVREQILQNWVSARLPPIRMLAKSIAMLIKRSWVLASPTINDVLDFPRMPVHGTRANSYPYEFLQFTDVDAIETDVVIVGSGCGGGVAAKNIAEAGCKVIVVEMGYHWSADHFPMTQSDGSNNLFMSGTAILCELFPSLCPSTRKVNVLTDRQPTTRTWASQLLLLSAAAAPSIGPLACKRRATCAVNGLTGTTCHFSLLQSSKRASTACAIAWASRLSTLSTTRPTESC